MSVIDANFMRQMLSGATENFRREFNDLRLRTGFPYLDLRSADLSNLDLREMNFAHVDLAFADLCGADIRGAALRGANLQGIRYDKKTILSLDQQDSRPFAGEALRQRAKSIKQRTFAAWVQFDPTACWPDIIQALHGEFSDIREWVLDIATDYPEHLAMFHKDPATFNC